MRGIKRDYNQMVSDDDNDGFSEDRDLCTVTGSTDHHLIDGEMVGGTTRKRRRGVIEKRRRDRINHSLNELKRLVPSALEKSSSAKLEKAEILQMTVDHIKGLQQAGKNNPNYDPQRVAMDYHGIGFRECAAEVAKYLTTVEGLDAQDPLRIRITAHLQMFFSSRAAASHNSTTPTPAYCSPQTTASTWTPPAPPASYMPPPPPSHSYYDNRYDPSLMMDPFMSGYLASRPNNNFMSSSNSSSSISPPAITSTSSASSLTPPVSQYNNLITTPTAVQHQQNGFGNSHFSHHINYPITSTSNNNKPHRPWGSEMAC